MELSVKNRKTLALYQCIHGARLSRIALDDLAIENLGVIHGLLTEYERRARVHA